MVRREWRATTAELDVSVVPQFVSHNPMYLVGLRQLTAPVILSDLAGKSHVLQMMVFE